MNERDLSRSKWADSADAWIRSLERVDVNRVHLLDEPMLAISAGSDVLDIGCGEGRFCRMLTSRGQTCVGLDPTVKLITQAQHLDPTGRYIVGSAEAIPFADASFDLAVFYLTLIDIPDFRAAIAEAARVLRPGGHLAVANLQSFVTTRPVAWYRDAEGNKLHVAVEDYFTERSQVAEWGGISILNFHRPLQSYLQAFLGQCLVLDHFSEPRPTPEVVAEHPAMRDEFIVPLFHVMRWRKPA